MGPSRGHVLGDDQGREAAEQAQGRKLCLGANTACRCDHGQRDPTAMQSVDELDRACDRVERHSPLGLAAGQFNGQGGRFLARELGGQLTEHILVSAAENARLQQLLGQGTASAGKQGPPGRPVGRVRQDQHAVEVEHGGHRRDRHWSFGQRKRGPPHWARSMPDVDWSATGAAGARAPSAIRRQVWRRPRTATE